MSFCSQRSLWPYDMGIQVLLPSGAAVLTVPPFPLCPLVHQRLSGKRFVRQALDLTLRPAVHRRACSPRRRLRRRTNRRIPLFAERNRSFSSCWPRCASCAAGTRSSCRPSTTSRRSAARRDGSRVSCFTSRPRLNTSTSWWGARGASCERVSGGRLTKRFFEIDRVFFASAACFDGMLSGEKADFVHAARYSAAKMSKLKIVLLLSVLHSPRCRHVLKEICLPSAVLWRFS